MSNKDIVQHEFADEMRREEDLLQKRFIHATRPRGPMTMQQAIDLCRRITPKEQKD
jgi:hypothetical protein